MNTIALSLILHAPWLECVSEVPILVIRQPSLEGALKPCEIFIAPKGFCPDAMRQCGIVIRQVGREEELGQMSTITKSKYFARLF